MNKKTQSKLVTAAKEVLATFCWKDESGCFYEEIYADYRDELDDGSLKKICEAEHPQEHFLDWLDEAYLYSRWDCEDAVIKRVLEDETVAKIVKRLDETEVYEIIRDLFYVKLPEKHFLRQNVLVDIMIDTGDANYDYTLNTFNPHYDSCDNSINEEASLLWLARQQGYKKSVLKSAMQKYPVESKFLNSIHTELVNSSTHMNTLTFLVKMSLEEYFSLQNAIAKKSTVMKVITSKSVPDAAGSPLIKMLSVDFMIRGTVPEVCWKLRWIKMSACRSAALKVQNMTAAADIPSGAFTVAVPASGKKLSKKFTR